MHEVRTEIAQPAPCGVGYAFPVHFHCVEFSVSKGRKNHLTVIYAFQRNFKLSIFLQKIADLKIPLIKPYGPRQSPEAAENEIDGEEKSEQDEIDRAVNLMKLKDSDETEDQSAVGFLVEPQRSFLTDQCAKSRINGQKK